MEVEDGAGANVVEVEGVAVRLPVVEPVVLSLSEPAALSAQAESSKKRLLVVFRKSFKDVFSERPMTKPKRKVTKGKRLAREQDMDDEASSQGCDSVCTGFNA